MKNILLTGSGGFIGKNLKEHFKEYNLFCPRSFELNLLDRSAVEGYVVKNKINFIIHSASSGVRINPNDTIDEVAKPNILMFDNLAKLDIKMITFGSGAEYDKSRALIKIKEDDFGKFIPKDPYGYSKYLISKEIEKRDNILNLRIFGIYGMGEDKSRVTTCIINDYINHRPIQLNQNVVFDFIYIEDFCKIVKHFVEKNTKEKFINIAPTKSIQTLELANIVNSFSNYECEIVFKKDGMNIPYTGDNSRLLSEISDFKFTNYEDGMKKFYEYLKTI